MYRGTAVISITYRSPALTAITNLGYGNAKAFPDVRDALGVMLATGPGYPPAVRVWTGKTDYFSFRPVQKPDPEHLGGPNQHPYQLTHGL
jgi:hypothetical protein